jgi:cleavage stimulation factor subunit 3
MADEAEQSFLAAQKIVMQEQDADGGEFEGSADTPDSDDYDPSATLPQDFSIPTEISQELPASARAISALPEDASAPHALLSPSQNRPSSTPSSQGLPSDAQFPTSKTPAQTQPRLKGGFVIEDEDEEVEADEDEDGKDGDVYDSADGMEASMTASDAVPQTSLNSTGSPHVSIQRGIQAPPKASNISNGASDVVPSSTAVQNEDALPRDSTATPVQSLPSSQVKNAQTSSYSGAPTSALPKARLAHDTIGILEDRIKEDPRGDMDAWLSLLDELRSRNKKDEVRSVYNRFFKQFPLAVRSTSLYLFDFLLTRIRRNNGRPTRHGRTRTTTSMNWSRFSRAPCCKFQMCNFGISI